MTQTYSAEAAEGLWPLTEGTFITQLLDSSGSATTAVAAVAAFYHLLLEGLFVLAGGPEQGSPIVSALAFGCNILPRLWRSAADLFDCVRNKVTKPTQNLIGFVLSDVSNCCGQVTTNWCTVQYSTVQYSTVQYSTVQ